ncbi:MAG: Uma2 family endonuclease [Anaerolineae bacterium]|jgi:Uma2 family endonuclease|nr:Uma2 family endonuclease [Anaerolineae bacterium]
MSTQAEFVEINLEELPVTGDIIAENVPYDVFLNTDYGDVPVEWVRGKVVIVAGGASPLHNRVVNYLAWLFKVFIDRTIKGEIYTDPTLMKVEAVNVSRAPDILYLAPDNPANVEEKQVVGVADLVVEVVSEGSGRTDRIHKFLEYEKAGVKEYWIVDFRKKDAQFWVLNEGIYTEQLPDEANIYHSTVLAGFYFDVTTLWQKPLPDSVVIYDMVQGMLKGQA